MSGVPWIYNIQKSKIDRLRQCQNGLQLHHFKTFDCLMKFTFEWNLMVVYFSAACKLIGALWIATYCYVISSAVCNSVKLSIEYLN